MSSFFALKWTLDIKINSTPSALLTLLRLRSGELSEQLRLRVVSPPFCWYPDLRQKTCIHFTVRSINKLARATGVTRDDVTLRHGRTCARDISELHAEDEAGLVSFSFGLLQHVDRETPALDAILVQDLERRLAGYRLLRRLRIIRAACLELKTKMHNATEPF